jgi:hypothetical protein
MEKEKEIWAFIEERAKRLDSIIKKDDQSKLSYLLNATKDEKTASVQALRKEIIRYTNERENYISTIEMENTELSILINDTYVLCNEIKQLKWLLKIWLSISENNN